MQRTLGRGHASSLYGMFSGAQIIGVIVLAVAFSGSATGQSPDKSPVKATLCELMKSPEQFNGKLVQFRAEYVSKYRWTGFVDDGCAAKIPVGIHHVLDGFPVDGQYAYITTKDEFEHPERLKLMPMIPPLIVTLNQDASYGALLKYADTKFRWKDGGVCLDCPLYRTTVSATGRFDYFPSQAFFVQSAPDDKPNILMGGGWDQLFVRVVLQSVSDVTATQISPSEYREGKRRNVSLQEAEALVQAGYLDHVKWCRKHGCDLEPQGGDSYFYRFQGWTDNPGGSGNMGFFEVDLQTADVWDGVVCSRYLTRSLVRLQQVIRRRIGLTEDEYRKLQRPGSICDPEETPAIYRR